ncbi:MAG: hypothetical protein L0Y72_20820 [Gemmataceae bacterium]|nr:hypothetical protein [Gemmataceae bacterium]MCI0741484.1 hypothetical protein [Gemmataceae bacterium]
MRQYLLAIFVPIAVIAVVGGCSRRDDDDDEPPAKRFVRPSGKGGAVAKGDPLKAPLDGVIKGRVVLDGDAPEMAQIPGMLNHNDKQHCLAGADFEKRNQTWIIGKDKGVENVVVFLRPPPGKYFELKDEDKNRTDTVYIDQPHCAFIPHVQVIFPAYWDGKELRPSGQNFFVKNSAPMLHNTRWQTRTGVGNRMVASGTELDMKLDPDRKPIVIGCDIHPWMNAFVWSFDHPYAARTKSDGTFEIKNVPTGVELTVFAWHEGPQYFYGGNAGTKTTFQAGENVLDLKVPAK